jgi:hypothetical protein
VKLCIEPGCDRKASLGSNGRPARRGYCNSHYNNKRAAGELGNTRKCIVEGCEGFYHTAGLCDFHARRKRDGVPLDAPRLGNLFNEIGACQAHSRVRHLWGPAAEHPCVTCGSQAAHWAYDGQDPEQRYGPNGNSKRTLVFYSPWPEFYMPLCVLCHNRRDKSAMKAELREYREWKVRTGRRSLSELCSDCSGKDE